jgi:hypothetical protein
MIVNLFFMPFMVVLMRTMLSPVLMVVCILRSGVDMLMTVFVNMPVGMSMGVFMAVMLSIMRVFVGMAMAVLVIVLMLVFMFSFHDTPPGQLACVRTTFLLRHRAIHLNDANNHQTL